MHAFNHANTHRNSCIHDSLVRTHQVSHFFVRLTLRITLQDRTLLIAEFGTNLKLPICNVCHMSCCFRTQQEYPLELSFQVRVSVGVCLQVGSEPLRDRGCLHDHCNEIVIILGNDSISLHRFSAQYLCQLNFRRCAT